ncbi:hypothetical protein OUZ56_029336 [Daphnia magna]|uniref:Uncharacterized protein n=1 Tax=Daphnia magna TaxID=35525 RepID=A0ABR0B6I2_9CRUS|nr:hypothetical protein OUZ56_029336 [Daphnia magna]
MLDRKHEEKKQNLQVCYEGNEQVAFGSRTVGCCGFRAQEWSISAGHALWFHSPLHSFCTLGGYGYWKNLLHRGVHGALVSLSAIAPWIHGTPCQNMLLRRGYQAQPWLFKRARFALSLLWPVLSLKSTLEMYLDLCAGHLSGPVLFLLWFSMVWRTDLESVIMLEPINYTTTYALTYYTEALKYYSATFYFVYKLHFTLGIDQVQFLSAVPSPTVCKKEWKNLLIVPICTMPASLSLEKLETNAYDQLFSKVKIESKSSASQADTHSQSHRVSEQCVESDMLALETLAALLLQRDYKAIITSGGPNSVYAADSPTIRLSNLYVRSSNAGKLLWHAQLEISFVKVERWREKMFAKIGNSRSNVDKVAEALRCVAKSSRHIISAIVDTELRLYGVQFHDLIENGRKMLHNFLLDICGLQGGFTLEKREQQCIDCIRCMVGRDKIVLMLGDHTSRVQTIHIDNGFLRKDESEQIINSLQELVLDLRGQIERLTIEISLWIIYFSDKEFPGSCLPDGETTRDNEVGRI